MCLLVDQQLHAGLFRPSGTDIDQREAGNPQAVPLMYMRTERIGGSTRAISLPITLPGDDDDETVMAVASEINAEIEG